jgi:hypothetical protein
MKSANEVINLVRHTKLLLNPKKPPGIQHDRKALRTGTKGS